MPNDGAKNLVQILDAMSIPRSNVAILSPCSSCKNRRDTPSQGKPACPRLILRKLQADLEDDGKSMDPSFGPALLTGSEGEDSPDTLRNPVYSEDHHILVWAAHLKDNNGVADADGNLLTPPITDPGFDTDYIVCNPRPYVVRASEASYFQAGSYREGDQLEVIAIPQQQTVSSSDGSLEFGILQVEGFAQKVNFAFGFNRKKVDKDLIPRGV